MASGHPCQTKLRVQLCQCRRTVVCLHREYNFGTFVTILFQPTHSKAGFIYSFILAANKIQGV